MSRQLLAIVALVTLFITSHALPLRGLVKRSSSEIIGYRAVPANTAAEYNKHGALIAFPASGTQTGQGAYLTARPREWGGPNSWTCVVYADKDKWRDIKKLWIPEKDPRNTKSLFFAPNAQNLDKYISEHAHMEPAKTVLFSFIEHMSPPTLQMLIPWGYLKGSHWLLPGKHANSNVPNITVHCFPPGSNAVPTHPAEWNKWFIPGFGIP